MRKLEMRAGLLPFDQKSEATVVLLTEVPLLLAYPGTALPPLILVCTSLDCRL